MNAFVREHWLLLLSVASLVLSVVALVRARRAVLLVRQARVAFDIKQWQIEDRLEQRLEHERRRKNQPEDNHDQTLM